MVNSAFPRILASMIASSIFFGFILYFSACSSILSELESTYNPSPLEKAPLWNSSSKWPLISYLLKKLLSMTLYSSCANLSFGPSLLSCEILVMELNKKISFNGFGRLSAFLRTSKLEFPYWIIRSRRGLGPVLLKSSAIKSTALCLLLILFIFN